MAKQKYIYVCSATFVGRYAGVAETTIHGASTEYEKMLALLEDIAGGLLDQDYDYIKEVEYGGGVDVFYKNDKGDRYCLSITKVWII